MRATEGVRVWGRKLEKNFVQVNISTSNEEKRWRVRPHTHQAWHAYHRIVKTNKTKKVSIIKSSEPKQSICGPFPINILWQIFLLFVRVLLHRCVFNFSCRRYQNQSEKDFPKHCPPKIWYTTFTGWAHFKLIHTAFYRLTLILRTHLIGHSHFNQSICGKWNDNGQIWLKLVDSRDVYNYLCSVKYQLHHTPCHLT